MSTEHVITPVRVYVQTFLALLVFTGLTVFAASVDLSHINPFLNTFVALTIAVTKAGPPVVPVLAGPSNPPDQRPRKKALRVR